jgi:hypothetical protein
MVEVEGRLRCPYCPTVILLECAVSAVRTEGGWLCNVQAPALAPVRRHLLYFHGLTIDA